ncbi:MAG: rRNA cytosine-C5-methylase [Rhodospirillales bacterium CG15_BIG_FIL_POST_REV_8_21_14_020_66_15]|nr:MAG: rRNA cytosine-C5-methylase [Rhodospirillales bacterium CG15_BIG_FIL_POST_REV_8_21_14_020_66_15]
MTPGARVQACIELLGQIAAEAQDASAVIDAYFRTRRYAGAGDRRAVSHRVYENLRHRARLDWWIQRTGVALDSTPRTRVLAQMAVYERTSPDQLARLFSGTRHCPPTLNNREQELAESLYGRPPMHIDMPDWVRLEYPSWMGPSLHAIFGRRLELELQALSQTAPVDLRVNTLKATREEVQAMLVGERIEVEPTPLSPIGLRLQSRSRLGGTQAFKRGLFEVQDEGSQLIALLTGVRPGMTVVDYCAGAGGKTLAMAAALSGGGGPRGRLIACDVSRYRMDRMAPRLKRAGADMVRRQVVTARDDSWVKANREMADRVLADVPCTGTGAWRRNLDAKWRFRPDDLEHLTETQHLIMGQAASLVAPKGRLVYATCSLLREENEEQIDWFLRTIPGFTVLSVQDVWAETVGGLPPVEGAFLRLSPASTGTDGFFCAILEKSG